MQSLRDMTVGVQNIHLAGAVGMESFLVGDDGNCTDGGGVHEVEIDGGLTVEGVVPIITGAGVGGKIAGIGRTGKDAGVGRVGVEGVVDDGNIQRLVGAAGHEDRHDLVVLAEVEIEGNAELPEVREAGGRVSVLDDPPRGWNGERRKNGDNADDHQHFEQSEGASIQCMVCRLICICSINGARSSFTSALASV